MFKIIPYSKDLDLTKFYQQAKEQGYYRHTDPSVFNYDRELRSQAWIVYQEDNPIASFAAHTLIPRQEFRGTIAYMIWNSMCVLKYQPIKTFGPSEFYDQHQNFHSQIVSPTCIKWVYDQEGTTDVDMFSSHTKNRKPPYNKIANKMRKYWVKEGLVEVWKETEVNDTPVEWIRVNHKAIMEKYESVPKWPITYRRSP